MLKALKAVFRPIFVALLCAVTLGAGADRVHRRDRPPEPAPLAGLSAEPGCSSSHAGVATLSISWHGTGAALAQLYLNASTTVTEINLWFYETLDGGTNWSDPIDVPGKGQGRRMFVRLNMVTSEGAFVTPDIEADPVEWTALGAASFPATGANIGQKTIRVSRSAAGPHFFVQSGAGGNKGFTSDKLWRYNGVAPADTWQQVLPPGGAGGFSVFDVNRSDPGMLIASHLPVSGDPQMVRTIDGGNNWTPLPELDALMTGNGQFRYRNQFGPTSGALNSGYPQPTFVAFDPADPNIVAAGAYDAGLFLSRDGGVQWARVQNPFWFIDGTPHITQPRAAGFVHTDISLLSDRLDLYVGTRGRGVFRTRTRVHSLNLVNLCDVKPRLCNPIPLPNPFEFILRPFGEEAVYISPMANHGACSRDCAPFFNLFLDGFDAEAWDVAVFDARGAAVAHGLHRTDRGVRSFRHAV